MTITWKYITIAAAAAVSLSFTDAPSVSSISAPATWEAVVADLQGPQGPAKKKVVEDSTLLFGVDDLAQSNWPGLRSVDGLGSLGDSPVNSSSNSSSSANSSSSGNPSSSASNGGGGGPGNGGGMASPKVPNAPWTPGGRLLPPAPTAPLSPFMP